MRTAALLLAISVCPAVQARGDADCAKLWSRIASVQEVDVPQWRVPLVPDEGSISGLSLKILQVNGHKFVPATLIEAHCALDRMLGPQVRQALREGATAYVTAVAEGQSEEGGEQLRAYLDAKLNDVFVPLGMGANTGLSRIRTLMEDAFEIERWSKKDVGVLQGLAFASRIYSPNLILSWLQIEYLDHLGVRGLDRKNLIDELQSQDASYAPPRSLKVAGCSEQLTYEWPTASAPISTYNDAEEYDAVHWAVCRPSGDVWVYHYRKGWTKAQASEKSQVCEEQGAEEPFRSFCRQ